MQVTQHISQVNTCLITPCSGSPAEKELAADNTFLSSKAESKVSLVNESQDKSVSPPGPVTPLRINPHSTKV